MRTLPLDVVATRAGVIESRHRVHAAVVGADDRLAAAAGDPQFVTFWRSCAKPFQVIPLVATGGFDCAGWGDDQLAMACASHGGEPEHVALAAGMLGSLGLEEGDLACGPHEPLAARGARLLRESGSAPRACTTTARASTPRCSPARSRSGGRTRATSGPNTPCSRRAPRRWRAGAASTRGTWCRGSTAAGWWCTRSRSRRWPARTPASPARRAPTTTCPRASSTPCARGPFLVGGTDRFDTVLLEETDGRVLAKVGAEGVHSVAIVDEGIGAAVKAEDGSPRAQYPAVLRLLQMLGALPDELPGRLADFMERPVRNTRGEVVGRVGPVE
jgi:L-asparaginase II